MRVVPLQRPLERSAHARPDLTSRDDGGDEHTCVVCHGPIVGRVPWAIYCSRRCSQRAARRRARGVPEDLYGTGGSRGSVRLDELTRAERKALAADLSLQVAR